MREPIVIRRFLFPDLSGSWKARVLKGAGFQSLRFKYGFEAAIWVLGLLAVGLPDPSLPSAIDLCLFKAIGFSGCPGCGLGHAMGYLFRAEWALAFESHWFSPVVLAILLSRIASLLRQAACSTN